MALFKKNPKVIKVGDQMINLEPKPSKLSFKLPSFALPKPKPKPSPSPAAQPSTPRFAESAPAAAPAPKKKFSLFGQSQKTIKVGDQTINLQPKPSIFHFGSPKTPKSAQEPAAQKPFASASSGSAKEGGFTTLDIKLKKPAFGMPLPKFGAPKSAPTQTSFGEQPAQATGASAAAAARQATKPSAWKSYVQSVAQKNSKLDEALREQNIKSSLFEFVQRMTIAALIVSGVIAVTVFMLFLRLNFSLTIDIVITLALAIGVFQALQSAFLGYPLAKKKTSGKLIERDLLFAARDMIISLRSGMPLFNAITSISSGYGEASKEFAKIVRKVQLGMPLEDAIDDTVATTTSKSFRRIMLQASVSIKAGADVVVALQDVIDQVSQERIIELRRYGQKLNALAMFYMLFGVILPSMGIAVVTILTTFISFFTVDISVLEFVLVGLLFLQVIFLQLIRSSRPVFSM